MGARTVYSPNFFRVEDEIIGRIDAQSKKRAQRPKGKSRRRRRRKK